MNGHKSNIISIFSQKGGCGKTCSTINIAGLLSKEYGKKVLVIDADTSANLTQGIAFSESPNVIFPEIIHQIKKRGEIDSLYDAICETDFNNLYILPCVDKDEYIDAAQTMNNDRSDPYHYFKTAVEEVEDDFDIIIFDVVGDSPELNPLALNALCASDFVLQPFVADKFNISSIADMQRSIDSIKRLGNPDLIFLGAFIARFDKTAAQDRDLHEFLQQQLNEIYIPFPVRQTKWMSKSLTDMKPICYQGNQSGIKDVVDDYRSVIEEILRRLESYNEEQ